MLRADLYYATEKAFIHCCTVLHGQEETPASVQCALQMLIRRVSKLHHSMVPMGSPPLHPRVANRAGRGLANLNQAVARISKPALSTEKATGFWETDVYLLHMRNALAGLSDCSCSRQTLVYLMLCIRITELKKLDPKTTTYETF